MQKYTKKDLAESLVGKFGYTKKEAGEIVETLFAEIASHLANGDVTDVSGFGKFVVKTRKAREGINPTTQEKITIPASNLPAFRPAKALKETVK